MYLRYMSLNIQIHLMVSKQYNLRFSFKSSPTASLPKTPSWIIHPLLPDLRYHFKHICILYINLKVYFWTQDFISIVNQFIPAPVTHSLSSWNYILVSGQAPSHTTPTYFYSLKFFFSEVNWWSPGTGRIGKRGLVVNGCSFHVARWRSCEICCPTIWIYLTPYT